MVAVFVCCCKSWCACAMHYTALKCKTSWAVWEKSSCRVLATELLWRKKADCLIPQRTWTETSGHRAGKIETTNTEAKQKRANCKPLRGVGLCYQQWAGFFSAQRWQRKGKLPKNPEGYFRVHSTEKTLKVMGPIGKNAGKDQHKITQ